MLGLREVNMSLKTTFHIRYNGATTTSTAANVTSDPINISMAPLVSVHAWFTGTPTGTITFEVSNFEDRLTDGYLSYTNQDISLNTYITHWVTAANIKNFPVANAITGTATTAGTPSEMAFNFQNLGFKWIRMVYTGNGTGTLEARISYKRNKSSNL